MSEQQKTNEAAQTLDGWYALHDFRTMDWTSWKMLSSDERKQSRKFVNNRQALIAG